jgi:MFS family permease
MSLSPLSALRAWYFLIFLSVAISMPFFPILLESRGLSPSQVGLVFSVSSIVSGLYGYYMGRVSDALGRLRVLQPNLLAGGVMVMLIPWSTDPLLLASIYTVFMACFSALITLATAYTIDSLDRAGASRGEGFGQIRIGGSIGWIPGSLSGGAIASAMGLEGVFIMTGIITLSSVIILLPLRECHGERESRGSGVRARILLRGPAGLLLLMLTLAFTANSALVSFLPLHMANSLGASPIEISLAFALMGLAEIPAMIYFGRLSDRVGRRPVLAICLLAFPLRLGLTGALNDSLAVALTQSLNALTFGGLYVVSIAYASDLMPEAVRGAFMGLYGFTFSLGGVVGGYLWGSLAEIAGYADMFLYSALFSILPLGLMFAASRARAREVSPSLEAR